MAKIHSKTVGNGIAVVLAMAGAYGVVKFREQARLRAWDVELRQESVQVEDEYLRNRPKDQRTEPSELVGEWDEQAWGKNYDLRIDGSYETVLSSCFPGPAPKVTGRWRIENERNHPRRLRRQSRLDQRHGCFSNSRHRAQCRGDLPDSAVSPRDDPEIGRLGSEIVLLSPKGGEDRGARGDSQRRGAVNPKVAPSNPYLGALYDIYCIMLSEGAFCAAPPFA